MCDHIQFCAIFIGHIRHQRAMRFSAGDGSQYADIFLASKGFHFSEHVPILPENKLNIDLNSYHIYGVDKNRIIKNHTRILKRK